MPAAYPLEAIVDALRASSIDGIDWGADGHSPFYQGVIDQLPNPSTTPFVVVDFPPSTDIQWTTEAAYEETFVFEVRLYGGASVMRTLGSPYVSDSIFRFLDHYISNPDELQGDGWFCTGFVRRPSFVVNGEARGPEGEPIYRASASYMMKISATLPS